MPRSVGQQHAVESSNLKSVGFYPEKDSDLQTGVIRIEFQRGAAYDYWPCKQKEFQEAFAPGTVIKDWFAKLKTEKQFKKVE